MTGLPQAPKQTTSGEIMKLAESDLSWKLFPVLQQGTSLSLIRDILRVLHLWSSLSPQERVDTLSLVGLSDVECQGLSYLILRNVGM